MSPNGSPLPCVICRRDFLHAAGLAAAGLAMPTNGLLGAASTGPGVVRKKEPATVRGAFLYPSTESLRQAGYYSWPGSGFDAEGHQKQYAGKIGEMAGKLQMNVIMEPAPLHEPASVTRFINELKQQKPDGLLLVPFAKRDWPSVIRIVQETALPTIAMATLGILLKDHIIQLLRTPGVYTISSLDDFGAIEYGLKMIRTAHWMKEALLLSVAGTEAKEMTVEHLGTRIRAVPSQRIIDVYKATESNAEVRNIAQAFLSEARQRREPTDADLLEAARAYVACKRLLAMEQADAIMMDCLGPLAKREFVAPCLGFMNLRDEGIVAGCQNDLNPTLTMMLIQQLFDRPGFQQNASFDSEKNLYFAAHCTCPRKMHGPTGPAEPYILRNHAEAGVGAVPQVLLSPGQEVTITTYIGGQEPRMAIYSGRIVACYDTPPAGGCRTNVTTTINEVAPGDMQVGPSAHMTLCYGNYARQLRAFCQMFNITAVDKQSS